MRLSGGYHSADRMLPVLSLNLFLFTKYLHVKYLVLKVSIVLGRKEDLMLINTHS
jgi:hypothetical protein